MCIVKNKIYKITAISGRNLSAIYHEQYVLYDDWYAIWFEPTLTTNGLIHNWKFILYCEEDKSTIERIYQHEFQLELNVDSYVEMEI